MFMGFINQLNYTENGGHQLVGRVAVKSRKIFWINHTKEKHGLSVVQARGKPQAGHAQTI